MDINEKFYKLIDQFYTIEKIVNDLEKSPRNYGTTQKFYSNETHTLKMIAEHEGINQKELSEKINVSEQAIWQYENVFLILTVAGIAYI